MGQIEFGHVGWGFQIDATRYIVGAVENPAGSMISPPGKTGFWSRITTTPHAPFALGPLGTDSGYDAWKELEVVQPDVAAARAAMQSVEQSGYAVFGNNCMDSTYAILHAFGLRNLPVPSEVENYAPVDWFRHIGQPHRALATPRAALDVVLYEHPEFLGSRLQIVSSAPHHAIGELANLGWLRRASSVVVRAGTLTLATGINTTGDTVRIPAGTAYPFLGGWARVARSLTVVAASGKSARIAGQATEIRSKTPFAPLPDPPTAPALASLNITVGDR
jgi:hypothetical protein